MGSTKNPLSTRSAHAKTVAFAAGGVALAAIVGAWWYHHVGPGYYAESEAIERQLANLPGVEVVEITWRDDDDFPLLPTRRHLSVRLRILGKGEMVLSHLDEDSFGDARHLVLVSAGSHVMRFRGKGDRGVIRTKTGEQVATEFAGGPIDIGPDGNFAGLFPFTIDSVQTAVARYDDIVQLVEDWPSTPSAPVTFAAADGTEFFLWTVSADASHGLATSDPLWNLPLAELRAVARPLGEGQ